MPPRSTRLWCCYCRHRSGGSLTAGHASETRLPARRRDGESGARRRYVYVALGCPRTQAELLDALRMSNSGILHFVRRTERDGLVRSNGSAAPGYGSAQTRRRIDEDDGAPGLLRLRTISARISCWFATLDCATVEMAMHWHDCCRTRIRAGPPSAASAMTFSPQVRKLERAAKRQIQNLRNL